MLALAAPAARLAGWAPLAGGLANTTCRLDLERGEPLVLRVYRRDPTACARELSLFGRLPAEVPLPPLRYAAPEHDPPFAVFALVPGQRLELALRDAPAAAPALGAVVGRALAAIHGVRLPALGFLDAALEVPEPFAGLRPPVAGYFAQLLGGRAGERLGEALLGRARDWISAELPRLDALDPSPRLCHSDFKPTNLLVDHGSDGWRLTAVLDWEFSFAFTPLGDVGQLLRHPTPPGFEQAFVTAYRAAGGELPPGWRTTVRLLDLLNLLGFLDGEPERPNVQRTCLALIQQTVAPDLA